MLPIDLQKVVTRNYRGAFQSVTLIKLETRAWPRTAWCVAKPVTAGSQDLQSNMQTCPKKQKKNKSLTQNPRRGRNPGERYRGERCEKEDKQIKVEALPRERLPLAPTESDMEREQREPVPAMLGFTVHKRR